MLAKGRQEAIKGGHGQGGLKRANKSPNATNIGQARAE